MRTYAITDEQLRKNAEDAAQKVARIHRLRLTLAVFFAALAVSCAVAYFIGRAVAHDAQVSSQRTCAVLQDVTTTVTDFVKSDADLRSSSAATFDTPPLRKLLAHLYATPGLGPALVRQAKLSQQYAAYWNSLVPPLQRDAARHCQGIG